MTGADVKRQVDKALWATVGFVNTPHPLDLDPAKFPADAVKAALDALAPCIVLTAEEAAHVKRMLRIGPTRMAQQRKHALALLTPDQEQTDEEFISEQTGGPC